ncbi:MAG TPA: phosphoribosylformylglycinamidine synthase subunit PurL [Chloroflexota bacterium]|nr:phosphoribosylformylglycinamidine synthase subunit PurL [Chloroflexota bacterium]
MTETTPAAAELRVLGLTPAEYRRIVALLGRTPNEVELGMFGAMWSEHCGYKHSKLLLRTLPTDGPAVVQGPGENAGAVSLGQGLLLVLKIESHNHPSAIEPYQGAATGAGGILRDIFAMGARPIALMDSLRFGLPASGTEGGVHFDEHTRFLFHGVVAGVGGYGNCMGIPTVGGETVFEPCYGDNPLVNVLCAGLVEEGRLLRAHGGAPGTLIVLFGAATGRDGIHGASFASVELDERAEERRPAVQVGDPLTEKLLLEACLDLRDRGLIAGLQDLGAAGLTSSTVEMADKTGSGISIDLDRVPRRAPNMTPYELMLSESQERMIAAVEPRRLAEVEAVLDRWELPHAVIGRITDDGLVRVTAGGTTVVRVPVAHFTDQCPVYALEPREDEHIRRLRKIAPTLPREDDWGQALTALLAHPNIGSKRAVWQRYDHMVGTNTIVAPGADAAVLRLKGRHDAVALSLDGNGRLCYLDPYVGGASAVLEAARNVSCVGARPLCATDGLNFGNPEKPGVAYQLQQAIAGMADACRALGIPIISGNVSLYNESQGAAIYPTPIVGVAGLLDAVARLCTPGFKQQGDDIFLLGGEHVSLGGSSYAWMRTGMLCGTPAPLDLDLERRVQLLVREAIAAGLLHSAHDCSDGGLAVALAECAIAGQGGATIERQPRHELASEELFGEGPARMLVSAPAASVPALLERAHALEVPFRRLGTVGGEQLAWEGLFSLALSELTAAWDRALDDLVHQ